MEDTAAAMDLTPWEEVVALVEAATTPVRIGLIGKYVQLADAYLSVVESLKHAGFHHGAKVEVDWIQAEDVEGLLAAGRLAELDGIVIPGGFGARGFEGKIAAARYAREEGVPCLGLCLGLQAMTIEFARNVLGLTDANSTEMDPTTPHPVIDLMHDQRDVTDKGGTMRLGAYYAVLEPSTKVARGLRRARRQRAPPPPLRVQLELPGPARGGRVRVQRACRRTAASSSSSSCATTRSGSAPRPTRSSRAGPTVRTRCSGISSAPPSSCAPSAARRSPAVAAAPPTADRPDMGDGFRHLGDRDVHQGHIWKVVVAEFEGPDGSARSSATSCARLAPSPSVPLVFDAEGNPSVVLVRQWRPPYEAVIYEIPAGMRDVAGEPTEVTARRELVEEAGLAPGRLDLLTEFYPSPGMTDSVLQRLPGDRAARAVPRALHGPEEEHSTVVHLPLEDAVAMVDDGRDRRRQDGDRDPAHRPPAAGAGASGLSERRCRP